MSHAVLSNCRSSLSQAARLAAEFDKFGMTAAAHGVRQIATELAEAIVQDERVLSYEESSTVRSA